MNNETMTAEIVEGSEWRRQDYEHDQNKGYVREGFIRFYSTGK